MGLKTSFITVEAPEGNRILRYRVDSELGRDLSLDLDLALNDDFSPGILDTTELSQNPNLKKYCGLRSQPPFMQRARALADNATDWCFLQKTCESYQKDAQELLGYLQNTHLLENLPDKDIEELLLHSRKIANEGSDSTIKDMGNQMVHSLEMFLKSPHVRFEECPGTHFTYQPKPTHLNPIYSLARGEPALAKVRGSVYLTPQNLRFCFADWPCRSLTPLHPDNPHRLNFRSPRAQSTLGLKPVGIYGLEGPIAYWKNVYALGDLVAIFGKKDSKRCVQRWDSIAGQRQGFWETRFWQHLALFQRRALDHLQLLNETNTSQDEERYVYTRGRSATIREAVRWFSEYQPYLEKIFTDKELPSYLSALAIVESQMNVHAFSRDRQRNPLAVGPYQFLEGIAKKFGLVVDPKEGIDERRNVIFSGIAAANLLKQARDAILQKGFVPGISFDADVANIAATSGYHAGVGNLRQALRKAKKDLERMGETRVTGEKAFVHLITSDLKTRSFRSDSKDYPPQLYAALDAVLSLPAKERKPVPKITLAILTKVDARIPLKDLARDISYGVFMHLNPQYDWDGWYEGKKASEVLLKEGSRFLILEADISRVKEILRDCEVTFLNI